MLNWNSLTWVDHSNSRRVNNCRVLMKFTMREARAGHGPGLHCQSRREWKQMSGVQAGHIMMMVLSLLACGPHHSCSDISGPRQQVREREWCDIRADPGLDIWSLVSRGSTEILIPLQGRLYTIVIYAQTSGEWGIKIHRRRYVQLSTSMWTHLKMSLDTADAAPPMANFAVPRHWRESPGLRGNRGGISSLLLPQWTET